MIQHGTDKWRAKNKDKLESEAPWTAIVRGAIWWTFYLDLLEASLFAFFAESIAVTYTFSLVYLIEYI